MTAEQVEPGTTATDDRRPAFRVMIAAALVKPPSFTMIVVHSFSRVEGRRHEPDLNAGLSLLPD